MAFIVETTSIAISVIALMVSIYSAYINYRHYR